MHKSALESYPRTVTETVHSHDRCSAGITAHLVFPKQGGVVSFDNLPETIPDHQQVETTADDQTSIDKNSQIITPPHSGRLPRHDAQISTGQFGHAPRPELSHLLHR